MNAFGYTDGWQQPATKQGTWMNSTFWLCTGERALKTIAQTLIALWGGNQFNILTVDWKAALGVSVGAGVLSVLFSVASLPVGPGQSPSLVHEQANT